MDAPDKHPWVAATERSMAKLRKRGFEPASQRGWIPRPRIVQDEAVTEPDEMSAVRELQSFLEKQCSDTYEVD